MDIYGWLDDRVHRRVNSLCDMPLAPGAPSTWFWFWRQRAVERLTAIDRWIRRELTNSRLCYHD
jgi:hypothetical protein